MDRRGRRPQRGRLDASPGPPARVLVGALARARRLAVAAAARFASRRFAFAFAVVSLVAAKSLHVYAHRAALPSCHLVRWGYSFFAQDTALLVAVRLLLDAALLAPGPWLRPLAALVAGLVVAYVAAVSTVSVSFFAASGSEVHWRNVGFAGDASSRALLLTGVASLVVVVAALAAAAWLLQDALYSLAGHATDMLKLPFTYYPWAPTPRRPAYHPVPQRDVESAKQGHRPRSSFHVSAVEPRDPRTWPWVLMGHALLYGLVAAAMLAHVVLVLLRPHESALTFMSWTPALLPFVDFGNSSPNLEKIVPVYGSGIGRSWDNRTALADVARPSWMADGVVYPGFEDWAAGRKRYSAAADPLKLSNLEAGLLDELRGRLGDVPIRHVVLLVLESTRKDVFPIKRDGVVWRRLEGSLANKTLPEAAQRRLATLSPTANRLTGDYDDGFARDARDRRPRGGISFNDAYSTSTYTIKSVAGTLCGVTPLVADFNLEYRHHIYQPCLPQVLGAFNQLGGAAGAAGDFSTYKWRSSYLASVVLHYDKQETLMTSMGFPPENLVGKEYLRSASAKFGRVEQPDINYFGMAETCLTDYVRDAFASARDNKERVFLTHLTSTSHHPFSMPADEAYVPLGSGLDDLSRYVNAIGFDDRWLGRVLEVLDDEGVADETLVVLVGDHGLSIPENGALPTYYNPNSASNHVPLVLSHPKLPPVTVEAAVSSVQVLPTVLDLLRETGSLSDAASEAARDLVGNYEGQSLVRPMGSDGKTGPAGALGDWQFTVINPGSAMLGVRDARSARRHWRLVVPVVDNAEWRFTSLDADPAEERPTVGFEYAAFVRAVEERHGEAAARWAEEGAFVARWWVEENGRRWRFGPYGD